ncbi:MAG: sodium:calcium antiporter, partial [Desulfobulbaceae bacterium]|nr:sodium:calcium antiporter [Desulfobulbaceae bacterium]
LVLLAYGSGLFIDGAVDVARYLKVSELVVGLTVAAVGPSLPELASSLSAVRRKECDILIGNIIGSNMFNLMMVMGGTALISPFKLDGVLLARDLPVMIFFTALLVPVLYFRHRLDRLTGLAMLLGYGLYIFWVV